MILFNESVFPLRLVLLVVKDAVHCDLYVGGPGHDKIPFDEITAFYSEYLK